MENEVLRTLIVPEEMEEERCDRFLADELPEYSRSYLQKLISGGRASVAGKPVKSSRKMKTGEELVVRIPAPEELSVEPEDIPLGINGVMRPGIVHRIDKNTTGALIVCKTDTAHRSIAEQLRVHSSNRVYRGIVHGIINEDDFTIEGNIGRDPKERKRMAVVTGGGKPAVTHGKVLERFDGYTYCEFRLETGRTHQIRVHMASKGHPLLGDDLYGPKKCPFALEGQTLHAMIIGFVHPSSGEYMEFSAPLPDYFQKLLKKFRKQAVFTNYLVIPLCL